MIAGIPGALRFLNEKLAVRIRPGTEAVTIYVPTSLFAVNMEEVAEPEESVLTVSEFDPVLVKVPLAPLPGELKVTLNPLRGDPNPSRTITVKGLLYG